MSDSREAGSIQVLNKAATLLGLLADRGELSAAELATLTGEPRSSVYRLLASLNDLQFVEPASQRGSFRLGLGLFRLGSTFVQRLDVRRAALPAMEALHRETGETINLCVRRGFEAVCVERLDGERVQTLVLRPGGSLPLHTGAAPLALLAFESPEFWDDYVHRNDLTPMIAGTGRSKRQLIAELKNIVEVGVTVSDEDVTPGIAAIGAPVFGFDGKVQASISVSGTKPLILGENGVPFEQVIETAQRASRALGYGGAPTGGA